MKSQPSWIVSARTLDLHGRSTPIWLTEANGLLWYAIHKWWSISTSTLSLGDVLYKGHILEKVSEVKQLAPNTNLVVFGTPHNGVNLDKLASHDNPLTHQELEYPNIGAVMVPIRYDTEFKLMSVEDFHRGVTQILSAQVLVKR